MNTGKVNFFFTLGLKAVRNTGISEPLQTVNERIKMFKYACIAAIAFAGATVTAAPASAHGSNCQYWNGPYCEFAHNVRHHGYQLPIVWERSVRHAHTVVHSHPIRSYPSYPQVTYPAQSTYWPATGTCGIQQDYGCGSYGYGSSYYGSGC